MVCYIQYFFTKSIVQCDGFSPKKKKNIEKEFYAVSSLENRWSDFDKILYWRSICFES
jgi:hypothetical protein